jgi:hypothetical protein
MSFIRLGLAVFIPIILIRFKGIFKFLALSLVLERNPLLILQKMMIFKMKNKMMKKMKKSGLRR